MAFTVSKIHDVPIHRGEDFQQFVAGRQRHVVGTHRLAHRFDQPGELRAADVMARVHLRIMSPPSVQSPPVSVQIRSVSRSLHELQICLVEGPVHRVRDERGYHRCSAETLVERSRHLR